MKRPRPSLRSIGYWQKFENSILATFKLALEKLAQCEELPLKEDKVNRKLREYVFEAITELNLPDEESKWSVVYEASNQPSITDEERSKREDKRPDFQCAIFDRQEKETIRGQKFFVIECKRLGTPPSSSWVLNRNYITNGVQRFIKKEWAYAADYSSGAMIGYLQTMTLETAHKEVGNYAKDYAVPKLELLEKDWSLEKTNLLSHQLRRSEVIPENFKLTHLWIDIRKQEDLIY